MTCNYSTSYPIPESTEYYLYDGINFTIHTYYRLTASGLVLLNAEIERTSSQTLFRGFFGGSSGCLNAWRDRCTSDFDESPNEFSITVSAYDSSTDDRVYITSVATTDGTESCRVDVAGKTMHV